MKKKFQIFISSTYSDLVEERQAAVEAILRSGHIPAGMELFSAGNESQLDVIKRWIEESDIYILILGGRYGSIESRSGLSYTEVEYQYALDLEKPYFALVMDESLIDQKVKIDGKSCLELENPNKLKEFREFVLNKICRFFKNETELKLAILESIIDIQSRNELVGWVRASEMPDLTVLLQENKQLRNLNTELEKKVKTQTVRSTSKDFNGFNFEETMQLLKSKQITVPASISNTSEEFKTNIYDLFIKYSSAISFGLVNGYSTSEANKFLLRKVIPTLLNFELVERIRASSTTAEKYITSKLGNKLIVLHEKKRIQNTQSSS